MSLGALAITTVASGMREDGPTNQLKAAGYCRTVVLNSIAICVKHI